jgi:hypothetical protein
VQESSDIYHLVRGSPYNSEGVWGLAVFPNKYSGRQKLKNKNSGLYSLENKK